MEQNAITVSQLGNFELSTTRMLLRAIIRLLRRRFLVFDFCRVFMKNFLCFIMVCHMWHFHGKLSHNLKKETNHLVLSVSRSRCCIL